ncbi:MAG: GTP-binding protein [Actinobacteria bacterium]|nr:GTP-binding protein [Actinomycetota bacterium]
MINPQSNSIEREEAELLSLINGFKLDLENKASLEKYRPPVVTIMGHVDHGKTTLLDFLRSSDIAKHEHGGITQKIGAFNVDYRGEKVTVIDTPGHQAFVNMRMRGATVTDMIVLVVSATEGVKQQTVEVIELARSSGLPMIIAINKIDLPEADPENVEKELADKEVPIEPFGGTIPVVHISAKQGSNVDLLVELILEQWKGMKNTAEYDGSIEATVLEAHHTGGDMNSATLLMQKGQLNIGDYIVAGSSYCRVKSIKDDRGNQLERADPGQAVEVVGFKELPSSGELVFEVDNESKARFVVDRRLKKVEEGIKRNITQTSSAKIKITSHREKRALYRGLGNAWLEKFKEL